MGLWNRQFKKDIFEHVYINTPECSFKMLINIISDFTENLYQKIALKSIN